MSHFKQQLSNIKLSNNASDNCSHDSRLIQAEALNEKLAQKLHKMQEDQIKKLEEFKEKY